jgi:hypothetical protein
LALGRRLPSQRLAVVEGQGRGAGKGGDRFRDPGRMRRVSRRTSQAENVSPGEEDSGKLFRIIGFC